MTDTDRPTPAAGPTPMRDTSIEDHQQYGVQGYCRACMRDWPCAVFRLAGDLATAMAEVQALSRGRIKMLSFIDQEIAMWSMAEVSPNLIPSMARFIDELRQLHTMLSNALAAPPGAARRDEGDGADE